MQHCGGPKEVCKMTIVGKGRERLEYVYDVDNE